MNAPTPVALGAAAALERLGTARLCSLTAVLVAFLALHLARLPLLLAARVLGAAMCRADAYITHQATGLPIRKEEAHAHT